MISLRFSVVMDGEDYAALPDHWTDPTRGRWTLWSYIDLRDAATSRRLALESDLSSQSQQSSAGACSLIGYKPLYSWRQRRPTWLP